MGESEDGDDTPWASPFAPSTRQAPPEQYAVVEIGGHQLIVEKGRWYDANRLTAKPGSTIRLGRVLAVKNGDEARFGTPYLDDVAVMATIIEERLGDKITVFKYKRKKHYRRTQGHRQQLTRFVVKDIVQAAEPLSDPAEEEGVEAKVTAAAKGRG